MGVAAYAAGELVAACTVPGLGDVVVAELTWDHDASRGGTAVVLARVEAAGGGADETLWKARKYTYRAYKVLHKKGKFKKGKKKQKTKNR